MIEKNDFGYVKILEKDRMGQIGYYDNDDFDDCGTEKAVVYLGTPCLSEYILVDYDKLTYFSSNLLAKNSKRLCKTQF